MSFTGFSILQASQISTQSADLAALSATVASHNEATLASLATINTAVDTKLATTVHDAYVSTTDATLASHGSRLDSVENRVTAVETDIGGRVQAAIDDKVAQGVFDSLADELRNADSALTASLATKVSAVTQAAVDQAQNDVIALKTTAADFVAYQASNDAAVATKVATTDFTDYQSTVTAALDTKASTTALTSGLAAKVDLTTYNTDKVGITANFTAVNNAIGARVTTSTFTTYQGTVTAALATKADASTVTALTSTVATKVDATTYASDKASLQASIDSKVAQSDYNNQVALINTAIGAKVAQSDFDSQVSALTDSIALKASQADLDSLSATVSTKADSSYVNNVADNLQTNIDTKLNTTTFVGAKEILDALNTSWEKRFLALEEFTRALLATYTIADASGNPYAFTGVAQNLLNDADMTVISKTISSLEVELSVYAYNALVGSVKVAGLSATKADFSASTRRYSFSLNPGTTYPLTLQYCGVDGNALFTKSVSGDDLSAPAASFGLVSGSGVGGVDYVFNETRFSMAKQSNGDVIVTNVSPYTQTATIWAWDGANWTRLLTDYNLGGNGGNVTLSAATLAPHVGHTLVVATWFDGGDVPRNTFPGSYVYA